MISKSNVKIGSVRPCICRYFSIEQLNVGDKDFAITSSPSLQCSSHFLGNRCYFPRILPWGGLCQCGYYCGNHIVQLKRTVVPHERATYFKFFMPNRCHLVFIVFPVRIYTLMKESGEYTHQVNLNRLINDRPVSSLLISTPVCSFLSLYNLCGFQFSPKEVP